MGNHSRDLQLIEAALAHKDQLTDEQIELLEWARGTYNSRLLTEAHKAFARDDNEVGMALAKAFCEKHVSTLPPEAECVIYCRVSSEGQTKGSGLWRQLKTCTDYAKAKHYSVVAVFSEVWSGDDDLYVRGQVERMAKARNCKIICEDYDRWSRKGIEDLPPKNVEMASDAVREMEEELRKAFSPAQLHIIQGGLA